MLAYGNTKFGHVCRKSAAKCKKTKQARFKAYSRHFQANALTGKFVFYTEINFKSMHYFSDFYFDYWSYLEQIQVWLTWANTVHLVLECVLVVFQF